MSVANKAQIDPRETELLNLVPGDRSIGNKALLRELKKANPMWTDELYWEIRNRLIDDRGHLERGRGKGGSVRRVAGGDVQETEVPDDRPRQDERLLYEPMVKVIKDDWAPDLGLDRVIVEVTAQGGARPDGKWSRPDVTLASYRYYPYVPGRHFDLVTFEIKRTTSIDVTCVYEALAHGRAATQAYALLHIPDDKQKTLQEVLDGICSEAKRMGVGVVVAGIPDDFETWERLVDATRREPEPQRLNDFLAKQVSQGFRDTLSEWFRQ